MFVKNHERGQEWLPGKIIKVTRPVLFVVRLSDGRHHRCHQDQLRHRAVVLEPAIETPELDSVELFIPFSSSETKNSDQAVELSTKETENEPTSVASPVPRVSTSQSNQRYPKRASVPPNRFEQNWT